MKHFIQHDKLGNLVATLTQEGILKPITSDKLYITEISAIPEKETIFDIEKKEIVYKDGSLDLLPEIITIGEIKEIEAV